MVGQKQHPRRLFLSSASAEHFLVQQHKKFIDLRQPARMTGADKERRGKHGLVLVALVLHLSCLTEGGDRD